MQHRHIAQLQFAFTWLRKAVFLHRIDQGDRICGCASAGPDRQHDARQAATGTHVQHVAHR
jgi:hypothetical protein